MKKVIAAGVFLAAAVSAAFAYPPESYWCHRACLKQGPVNSDAYKECMAECLP